MFEKKISLGTKRFSEDSFDRLIELLNDFKELNYNMKSIRIENKSGKTIFNDIDDLSRNRKNISNGKRFDIDFYIKGDNIIDNFGTISLENGYILKSSWYAEVSSSDFDIFSETLRKIKKITNAHKFNLLSHYILKGLIILFYVSTFLFWIIREIEEIKTFSPYISIFSIVMLFVLGINYLRPVYVKKQSTNLWIKTHISEIIIGIAIMIIGVGIGLIMQ